VLRQRAARGLLSDCVRLEALRRFADSPHGVRRSRTNLKSGPGALLSSCEEERRARGSKGISPQMANECQQSRFAACPVPRPKACHCPATFSDVGLFYSLRDFINRRKARESVYIRALTEPFSLAETIEIETNKRSTACAAKSERELLVHKPDARNCPLTTATKRKR
jgi:hypothetical protein